MKLFRAEVKIYDKEILTYFIVAGNEYEARTILEEESFNHLIFKITYIQEEDLSEYPRIICSCSDKQIF